MKKSLLALAVLGAFAGAASAQSSVTLFGGLDVSSRTVKNELANGSTETQRLMANNGIYSSRFGIRGVEDLGGGAKAGFHLEAALNPDDGTVSAPPAAGTGASTTTGSQLFNRRSTVSLFANFGEVRLGRDYTPQFWNLTNYDPFDTNGVADSNKMTSKLGTTTEQVRVNNSVGYFLPSNLGGVYGQLQLSTSEATTPNGTGNTAGRLGYAAGPLDIAVVVAQTKVAPVLINGVSNDEKLKTLSLGMSFQAGPAKLMAYAQQVKRAAVDLKQTNFLIGTVVNVGTAGKVKLSYDRANASGAGTDNNDATLIGLGYEHSLSKRTSVYANYAQIKNKEEGTATYQVGTANGQSVGGGKKSTGYEFGVKHTF